MYDTVSFAFFRLCCGFVHPSSQIHLVENLLLFQGEGPAKPGSILAMMKKVNTGNGSKVVSFLMYIVTYFQQSSDPETQASKMLVEYFMPLPLGYRSKRYIAVS